MHRSQNENKQWIVRICNFFKLFVFLVFVFLCSVVVFNHRQYFSTVSLSSSRTCSLFSLVSAAVPPPFSLFVASVFISSSACHRLCVLYTMSPLCQHHVLLFYNFVVILAYCFSFLSNNLISCTRASHMSSFLGHMSTDHDVKLSKRALSNK